MVATTALKLQFPTLQQEVNGHPLAYLDNAATTQRPIAVLEAMDRFNRSDNSNVHRGVHSLSMRATDAFDAARAAIAAYINSPTDRQLLFTKGCTEAINLVASSWGKTNLSSGDVVLLSTMEHHANILPWQAVCKETGAKILPIPISDECVLDLEAMERLLESHPVKVVGVKHVCNATGTVNPVAEVARLAHGAGAVIVVDGAQALAHERIDVQAMKVDFYALAAHKAYGPMGMGALFGRLELLEAMPPYQLGGGMIQQVTFEETTFVGLPDKFEPGTPNVMGAIGFAAAIDWISSVGVQQMAARERELLHFAVDQLQQIPGLRLIGTAPGKAAVVSFVLAGVHPHDIGTILDSEGVAVRSGHHCCQPLMARLGVPATARASIACYNDESDIAALVRGLVKVSQIFA